MVAASTAKARASNEARRIIRAAYTLNEQSGRVRPVRYELLGSGVAIAVGIRRSDNTVVIKVAQQAEGRCRQMRKESRIGFQSAREIIAYFDALYARYGRPQ
jgi:hypothetical protein